MKTLFILISLFFAVSLSARQRDSRVRTHRLATGKPADTGRKPFASFWKRTIQSCES